MNWYKEWYMKQTDTGIEQNVNDEEVIAAYYYNIAGVKVNKPKKGIYLFSKTIVKGRKDSFLQSLLLTAKYLLQETKCI